MRHGAYLCSVNMKLNPLKDTTMKKMFTYMAMAAMTMALFTSCDVHWDWEDMEDRCEASMLDGTWTGQIDTYYYDRWGLTGDSYRTTMYFEQEDAYSGWGYEVDYDLRDRYSDYYYCEFEWEVYKGSIRIRYADSWNDVYIYDYRLNGNRFEGRMDDGSSKDILFRLNYDGAFSWGYWNSRSDTRGDGVSDSISGEGTHDRVKASGVFAKSAN